MVRFIDLHYPSFRTVGRFVIVLVFKPGKLKNNMFYLCNVLFYFVKDEARISSVLNESMEELQEVISLK